MSTLKFNRAELNELFGLVPTDPDDPTTQVPPPPAVADVLLARHIRSRRPAPAKGPRGLKRRAKARRAALHMRRLQRNSWRKALEIVKREAA